MSSASGGSKQDLGMITGGRVSVVTCPGVRLVAEPEPLCTIRLRMMPNSRAAIPFTCRDAYGVPVATSRNAQAIFRMAGVTAGPRGDSWPAVDLATVEFQGNAAAYHVPFALIVGGAAPALTVPNGPASDLGSANAAEGVDPTRNALPPVHKRRIFFDISVAFPNEYRMGYEDRDEKGNPVPGTFSDATPFDPMQPMVCVQLGPHKSRSRSGGSPSISRARITPFASIKRRSVYFELTSANLKNHFVETKVITK